LLRPIFLNSNWKLTQYSPKLALKPNAGFNVAAINASRHALHCHADPMLLSADHAIPLGLLINELVTNAVKCAYPEGAGAIEVNAREMEGHLHVEVSDQGIGLPDGFDIDPRASLGFKVITGLVRQLQGHLKVVSNNPKGTHFPLDLPILPKT
jgi:two-component system, sensor histidine kinase PdtaS